MMFLVSEEQLQKNIKQMKASLTLVEKNIESFSKTKDPDDKFSVVLSISFSISKIFNLYLTDAAYCIRLRGKV